MNNIKNFNFSKWTILFIPFLFLFLFLVLPLLNVFLLSLFDKNGFLTLDNYFTIISHPLNGYFFYWTFQQALITTFLSIILGIGCSYILTYYSFPGKRIMNNLLLIPFLMPPIVVLMSFISVFGNGGWINQFSTFFIGKQIINIYNSYDGIILAHIFYNIPVIIRLTQTGWRTINPEFLTISKSLGGTKLQYFFQVELPHIFPSLLTASLLVFIYSFNSFAIVLILGGVQYQTIEVRIYSLIKYSFDYNGAAVLSILQLIINILVIIFYLYLTNKYDYQVKEFSSGNLIKKPFTKNSKKLNFVKIILITSNLFLVLLICTFPLIGVILKSLTSSQGQITFNYYFNLFDNTLKNYIGINPFQMIFNTILFGFLVLICSLFLALLLNFGLNYKTTKTGNPKIGKNYLSSLLVILPLTVSSITLMFSIFSLYRNTIIYAFVPFTILIAHTMIAFPFANRIIATGRANMDKDYLNIGRSLGFSRTKVFFKVELPLLLPYIIIAGLFSLAISIGEFGATNFVSKGDYVTIPVGIYRLVNTRHLGEASAFSTVLIGITLLLFYLIERLGKTNFDFKI